MLESNVSANHRHGPKAILVAAHPIWNVPPFFNAAAELARAGFSATLVGYQARELPEHERLEPGFDIVRLPVSSRRIGWDKLRKPAALFEFLIRARSFILRENPEVLIAFNDPASILQRCTGPRNVRHRVNWLLEYPELERFSLAERQLFRFSASCWSRADAIVTPTVSRLALHLALRPDCNARQTMVIQNAPRRTSHGSTGEPLSERTRQAMRILADRAPGTIRIIYSGAIGNRYGADSLIRAVGSFPHGVHLLLLGPKHPLAESEVESALRQTRHPENIDWIDEVPYRELPHVLEEADVGFATYRGDTLNTRFSAPGKLYEYLKCGLAILSDSECCIRAETTAAGCGLFFPRPVTDDGIRKSITYLLENPRKVSKMKAAAHSLFQSTLCMEEQVTPLIALLRESMAQSPQSARPDLSPVRATPATLLNRNL